MSDELLKEISTKLDKVIELLTPPEVEPVDNRRIVIKEDKNGKRQRGRCNVDERGMWVSVEWE